MEKLAFTFPDFRQLECTAAFAILPLECVSVVSVVRLLNNVYNHKCICRFLNKSCLNTRYGTHKLHRPVFLRLSLDICFYITAYFERMSWVSSVNVVTRLLAGTRRNSGLIPGRDKRYFSSPKVPDRLYPNQLPLQWIPDVKRRRIEADQPCASNAEVRNAWNLRPLLCLFSWCGDYLSMGILDEEIHTVYWTWKCIYVLIKSASETYCESIQLP